MEIAKSEGYCSIEVEGDAKICFDALNGYVNS
jgi:ribonuclease HI